MYFYSFCSALPNLKPALCLHIRLASRPHSARSCEERNIFFLNPESLVNKFPYLSILLTFSSFNLTSPWRVVLLVMIVLLSTIPPHQTSSFLQQTVLDKPTTGSSISTIPQCKSSCCFYQHIEQNKACIHLTMSIVLAV